MFTARYGLIPYIKQIMFRLQKVNGKYILSENTFRMIVPKGEIYKGLRTICILLFPKSDKDYKDNVMSWTSRKY